MTEALLSVGDVKVLRGLSQVVHGVSFKLERGKVSALLGVNGAGKTSLVLAVAGLLPCTGEISLEGKSIVGLPAWTRSHQGIALVQEGRRLFHGLTVADNLGLGSWRRGRSAAENARQLDFVHGIFPVLKSKANSPSSRLSGGEQQMLAVAQGLMTKPKLLILDEPTAGLAPKIVSQMLDAIQRLAEEGYSILLVDQSPVNARRVAERIMVMRLGRIIKEATAEGLDEETIAAYLS